MKLNENTNIKENVLISSKSTSTKTKYRSKTITSTSATEQFQAEYNDNRVSTESKNLTVSKESAFKPFKTKSQSISSNETLNTNQLPSQSINESKHKLNEMIVKRRLEDLLDKTNKNNRSNILNHRRSKSFSSINENNILFKMPSKISKMNSMLNIHIDAELNKCAVSNKYNTNNSNNKVLSTQNVLLIDNLKKQNFNETKKDSNNTNFITNAKLKYDASSSSPTTATSPSHSSPPTFKTQFNAALNEDMKISMIRYPCSISLFNLIILIFRLKDASSSLTDFIIPTAIEKLNIKFFQAKFHNILNVYKVSIKKTNRKPNNIFVIYSIE